ncbi:hypothetical protein [Lactococcus fujiensis]|uniref:hypothetical protein n=1 Tax=Lactococcus fujiensis TaxID=610251 RepID=UPI0006D1339E|nr:hypothetical protein [Lactococcus fujiensis]
MNNDWNFKSFVDILIASRKTIRDNVSRSRPKIAERLFYLILPSSVCGNDEKAAQKYVAAGEKPPLEITDDHSAEARSIYGLSDDEITEQYITSNEFDEIFDFFHSRNICLPHT